MKRTVFILVFIWGANFLSAQPWPYDFGTSIGSHTSGESTTFLPAPSLNGGTAKVYIGSGGGSFNLENPGVVGFGSGSELRGVASTASTPINKFSVYDHSAGKSFTIRFYVRFGGGESGTWWFLVGDGSTFSDGNTINYTQTFATLRFTFGGSSTISTQNLDRSSWNALSNGPSSQNTTYLIEIYGNNTTGTINYTYGTSQSVASNRYDIWIDGVLRGNDEEKSFQFANDVNIDSWQFYGEGSISNVANIYIDDISYSNIIEQNPLPVELNLFTAVLTNNQVILNWQTATELNNYGFEIERQKLDDRSKESEAKWNNIGFVEGHGNSNSPKEYTFTDEITAPGKYSYRLKQIDTDGSFEYSGTVTVSAEDIIPDKFDLFQNYPNPFNPVTKIKYSIPDVIAGEAKQSVNATLKVYDIIGREVAVLVNESKEAGIYEVEFDASKLSSGMYFYSLNASGKTITKKMMLLR